GVPTDLRDGLLSARRAADVHPPLLEQAALADLMSEGHFDRHLRRMRAAYRERLDAFTDAAARWCQGGLALRPVRTGLHAVADLTGVDAGRGGREANARALAGSARSHRY